MTKKKRKEMVLFYYDLIIETYLDHVGPDKKVSEIKDKKLRQLCYDIMNYRKNIDLCIYDEEVVEEGKRLWLESIPYENGNVQSRHLKVWDD